MTENPLASLANYSQYVAELLDRRSVKHSTVVVWSDSPYTGTAEGEVLFKKGCRLRIAEADLIFRKSAFSRFLPLPYFKAISTCGIAGASKDNQDVIQEESFKVLGRHFSIKKDSF